MPDEALTEKSKALIHEREENYLKDRPAFQCQPAGPETLAGWRRIIQTPSLIAIAYETLTYRFIFMDGRQLEAESRNARGWGTPSDAGKATRWSWTASDSTIARGWTLAGMPHTEALRTTERYVRRTVGQMQVELTVTDPGAFAKSWTVTYDLEFQPDTEMVEARLRRQEPLRRPFVRRRERRGHRSAANAGEVRGGV